MKTKRKINKVKTKRGRGAEIIAVLGPRFSFTDLASRSLFAKRYYGTIKQVVHSVLRGKTAYGLVPFRNSSSGLIAESAGLLRKHRKELLIEKKYKMKISHVLAVFRFGNNINRRDSIKAIMTNKIIFNQCGVFLKKHFPKAKRIYSKTSSAACLFLKKSKNKNIAVIASQKAAEHYGLKVMAKNIENRKNNTTQFILFSRRQ